MATESLADLLTQEQGDDAFRKLMAAPVSAQRKRIRHAKVDIAESVDTTGKSLADIYCGRRKPYRGPQSKPLPTYEQWLRRVMPADDAEREAARAKAEWAAINAHPFIARVCSGEWSASPVVRARVLARIRPAAPELVGPPRPEPLSDLVRLPRVVRSRSSWSSYRQQQLDALYAEEGIAGLLSVGAVEEITIEPMQEAA